MKHDKNIHKRKYPWKHVKDGNDQVPEFTPAMFPQKLAALNCFNLYAGT